MTVFGWNYDRHVLERMSTKPLSQCCDEILFYLWQAAMKMLAELFLMFGAGDSLLCYLSSHGESPPTSHHVAMDVESRENNTSKRQVKKKTWTFQPKHPTADTWYFGKMLKSKRYPLWPASTAHQKASHAAIANPAHWSRVTQFFSLAKTNDLHAETENWKTTASITLSKSLIPLLVEAWGCFVLAKGQRTK